MNDLMEATWRSLRLIVIATACHLAATSIVDTDSVAWIVAAAVIEESLRAWPVRGRFETPFPVYIWMGIMMGSFEGSVLASASTAVTLSAFHCSLGIICESVRRRQPDLAGHCSGVIVACIPHIIWNLGAAGFLPHRSSLEVVAVVALAYLAHRSTVENEAAADRDDSAAA